MVPLRRRYRCRYCGVVFNGLPVTQEPNGAVLLNHLAARHPDRVGQYLDQMPTDDDHDRVVVEAYEVIEGDEAS
jgi:hypothetical protein